MKSLRVGVLAVFAVLGVFAAGSADVAGASVAQAPKQPPAPTQAQAPLAGRMRLQVLGVRGREAFAIEGRRVDVRGTVSPYVPGQHVSVHFYLDGRRVSSASVAITPSAHRARGTFQAGYANARAGQLRVVAVHEATPSLKLFAAGSQTVKIIAPDLSVGSRGEAVWVLQRSLGALHYAVPESGYYDEATADAVIAFRKMTGLARVPNTEARVFEALARGEGAYRVRFPWDGKHIEANLQLQVLVEVEPHGRVREIYMMSSGKPSTPTLIGHFSVYRKEPGVNSEEMFDANYFITGYAVHGYPEVPTYAASHGCLRIPDLDAPAVNAWLQIGTGVDVYE